MKGLILKDIFLFKSVLKSFIAVVIFYTFFAFTNDNSSFLTGMVILVISMLAITSFSYDERSKWDRYALTMPVTRDEIVLSKYILAFLLSLTGFIISIIFCLIIDSILNRIDLLTTLAVGFACFEIALTYLAILMPIVYKTGVEKLRIIMMAVFFVPSVLLFALVKMGMPVPDENALINLFKLSPIFVVILCVASFFISCFIYRKKEI